MDEKEKLILKKTLEIESKIAGVWRDENGEIWSFSKIEPSERGGKLFITFPTNPSTGQELNYEIIWVADDNIQLNIIMPNVPKPPDQHKIEFMNNSLSVSSENLRRSLNKG